MLTLFLLLHEQYIYTCIMRMVGHITCHSIISVCVCGGGGGGVGERTCLLGPSMCKFPYSILIVYYSNLIL